MSGVSDYLVGSCRAYADFLERLGRAAASEATVLLGGESGAGKGAAARALHAASPRAGGPLVLASVAALPESLVESELFGHERGAYTDAHRARPGCFRRADGGTLVLDDVDLLPLGMQVKLLRVLQEREVEPVGGEGPVPVDVRVVATTNRDLAAEVAAERFREDLFYRLAVVTLTVPPLRARQGDIPELARACIERLAAAGRAAPRSLSPAALERLASHAWPGNVRELENALERVLALPPPGREGEPIGPGELDFLDEPRGEALEELARQALAAGIGVDEMASAMMQGAFREQRGNVSAAARQVGLTRRAFEYRLSRAEPDRTSRAAHPQPEPARSPARSERKGHARSGDAGRATASRVGDGDEGA